MHAQGRYRLQFGELFNVFVEEYLKQLVFALGIITRTGWIPMSGAWQAKPLQL